MVATERSRTALAASVQGAGSAAVSADARLAASVGGGAGGPGAPADAAGLSVFRPARTPRLRRRRATKGAGGGGDVAEPGAVGTGAAAEFGDAAQDGPGGERVGCTGSGYARRQQQQQHVVGARTISVGARGYRNARADSLDGTPRAGPMSMSRERRAASFDDNSWQRGSMPTEALIAADAGESPANLPNNGATAEAVGDSGRDTKQERVERTVGGAATTTPLPSIDDWDFFAQIDATHEGDPTVTASSAVASDEQSAAIAANGAFPPSVKVTSSARASVVQRATDDPFASLFSELSLRPEHASATPSLR
eukprot:ctg_325.g84